MSSGTLLRRSRVLVRPIQSPDIEPARQLLLANGWTGARFEPEPFAQMIIGTPLSLVAIVDERVAGFLRAITDGMSNGYLCTLVVAEAQRRQGVARALVGAAMGTNTDMTWVLRAERPGLFAVYEKLGFRVSTVAMERVRVAMPGAVDANGSVVGLNRP